MPAFIQAIWGALLYIAPSLVGRVLAAIGIGVVTYTGVSTSITYLLDQASASLGGISADILGMMAHMKVGESISIVTSAILVKMTLNGLTGDTFKRWVTK